MMNALAREFKRASRHRMPLTFGLADLDGFKRYNDTYGHVLGDELLEKVGQIFKQGRRAEDVIARYGGDEFGILLPGTDAAGAMVVADRLRTGVAFALPVTVSIGLSTFPGDGVNPQELISHADTRLYTAKTLGHNQVIGPSS